MYVYNIFQRGKYFNAKTKKNKIGKNNITNIIVLLLEFIECLLSCYEWCGPAEAEPVQPVFPDTSEWTENLYLF